MLGELSPGRGCVALQGPASPTPSHALARDSPQSPENSALSSDFIVSGAAVWGGRPRGFSEASCPERARPPDLTCFRRAEGRGGRRWVRGGAALATLPVVGHTSTWEPGAKKNPEGQI